MKKKKIIITGGAGFIGSHLAEKVHNLGHNIIVIDNFSAGNLENLNKLKKKIKIVKADIKNSIEINKYFKKVDIVFHLAALADIVPSIQKPTDYFEANVVGTYNILNACVLNNVKKIVYTASASCYGISKDLPTKESSKTNTEYPYALTKKLGEDMVLHWGKVYNLNFTSLRLFNVYGPRSRTSGTYGAMFGVFLAQKLANKPFTIVGSGNQCRDFTFVSDVVDAFILAGFKKKSRNEIFNVGSGIPVSVNRIAKLLEGKKIYIPKRPGEPFKTFADISKIKSKLKWKPKVKIEDGIKVMLKNINYWKKAPIWNSKTIQTATKDWFKYLK